MVKFNVSLSRKYYRIEFFHNLQYWKRLIFRMFCILLFLPVFIYGMIEDGFSFVMFVALVFWLIPLVLFIDELPCVCAARARKVNIRYSVSFSSEGMHMVVFDGSEEEITDHSFDKCKRIVERKNFFFVIFDEEYAYLMKSDIVEGSVEELRMIFIGEAGEKCIGLKR